MLPSAATRDAALPDDAELERLSRFGQALYEERLRSVLEPDHIGEDVAIHLDSGDYEVGPRASRPQKRLRARHPEGGLIMVRDVGPPRDDLLAQRMLSAKMASAGARGGGPQK